MARSFEGIYNEIIAKLQAISDLQEVQTYPDANFSGFPSACAYPTTQDGAYFDTLRNERVYNFTVEVFYETKNTNKNTALVALFDVVDQILDSFDQDFTMSSATMPAGKDIFDIVPVSSLWGEIENEELIGCQISIQVRVASDYK